MKPLLRACLITIAVLTPRLAGAQLAVAWNDDARTTGLVRILRTLAPWEFRAPPTATGRDATLQYHSGRLYAVSSVHPFEKGG